tara:strand:+ start:1024 stop:1197 length:174 start_codon:yes stop_codon:yes gene_type:complete
LFEAGELCIFDTGPVRTDFVGLDGAKYLMAWRPAQTPMEEAACSRRTPRLSARLQAR